MPSFNYTFQVKASIQAVANFHSNTKALSQLTPPPVFIQLHKVEPLAEGSLSDFTMWFGPFPVRWLAQHSQVSLNGFTDTQRKGPMLAWQHTHTFESLDQWNCRITEHVEFIHRPGVSGWLTKLFFSPLMLRGLFSYRAWVTKRLVSSP